MVCSAPEITTVSNPKRNPASADVSAHMNSFLLCIVVFRDLLVVLLGYRVDFRFWFELYVSVIGIGVLSLNTEIKESGIVGVAPDCEQT